MKIFKVLVSLVVVLILNAQSASAADYYAFTSDSGVPYYIYQVQRTNINPGVSQTTGVSGGIIFVDLKGVQGNKVVDEIRYKFSIANGSVGYALFGGWRFATLLESDALPQSGRARMVYNLVTSSEFQKNFKSEWEVLFDSVNPNRIFNQGDNHFLKGEYSNIREEYLKAIPYYKKLLEPQFDSNKFQGKAIIKLGLCYFGTNQLEMAKYYYEQAKKVQLDSHDDLERYYRGLLAEKLQYYDVAISEYNTALKTLPRGTLMRKDAEDHLNNIISNQQKSKNLFKQGNACAKKGQHQEAINFYNQAASLYADAGIYYNLGNSYFLLKDYHKAIAAYNEAIRLKSDYAEAYNNRGGAYEELKLYKEAAENYETSIKYNKNKKQIAETQKNLENVKKMIGK